MLQLNPDVNAFQRKFVNEVRRCDEMERKLSMYCLFQLGILPCRHHTCIKKLQIHKKNTSFIHLISKSDTENYQSVKKTMEMLD